ncbi:MAG: dienelactone hydrolase family protein [Chitinophagaceae bacterium]|nr:dienelactone hydrolase family protein [Chitinophagaceae bacterium]
MALFAGSCNNSSTTEKNIAPMIKEENPAYTSDSANLTGFLAYDSANTSKRPVVFIIHEWWGLNDYVKSRARQLAAMGYLAFAIDMYGDGKMGNNPDEAGKLAGPFYGDPQLAKARFDAALQLIRKNPLADTSRMAAIGYCFGGGMALNLARLGEPLNGVVSFHGSLIGVPADKATLKAKILVCHGADDQFVKPEEVAQFKKQMDSVGADYTFKSYIGATHAFSNPNATKMGEQFKIPIAYNATADSASWKEMQVFSERYLSDIGKRIRNQEQVDSN